jgi:hypothetical protein
MPATESTPQRLVLVSGSTTLTLDKGDGKATLQRKMLFWKLKPTELPLAEFWSIAVDKVVDRASGVEIFHTMLITRGGAAWAFPASDKQEAEANVAAIRAFLELHS